jgi:hypothetical protein
MNVRRYLLHTLRGRWDGQNLVSFTRHNHERHRQVRIISVLASAIFCHVPVRNIELYFEFSHSFFRYSDNLAIRLPGCRTRGPGCDSRHCHVFWVAVGPERGPLSPCEDKWGATWKKSSGCGLEYRLTIVQDPPLWPHDTPLSKKLGLNFVDKWRSLSRYISLAE